jgi:hypothetical protein
MNIDYNAITAWAAMLAAIAAVLTLYFENKRSRFSVGIDLLLKLDERYDTVGMRRLRRSAAKSLLAKSASGDVDEVLDFFEMIGFLVQGGALDKKMVWHNFFHSVSGYWNSAKEYIQQEQERLKDPTVWRELDFLYKSVTTIEKRERKCLDSDLLLSKDSIEKFLQEEAEI